MSKVIEAPVLLIVFNRPDTTTKVFEAIRIARPKKLYVSADAPRQGNINDEVSCKETRAIVQNVDWDCDVHYQFHDVNLGCGPGPATAISWIFEHENRAIILEDDCVPAISFFQYCNELLEKYKEDNRIWLISGNNYNEERKVEDFSYFISRYGHSWGWATWKRAWNEFDITMSKFPKFIVQNQIFNSFPDKKQAEFFFKIYNRIYSDKNNLSHIWDFQFGFSLVSNGALCIVPSKNLVTNIGFVGTHSSKASKYHNRAVDDEFIIKKHPDFILASRYYDDYHFKNHWVPMMKSSLVKRIFWKSIKLLIKRIARK